MKSYTPTFVNLQTGKKMLDFEATVTSRGGSKG